MAKVQFISFSVKSLVVLFFCQYWARWYNVFTVALNCWNNLHILSVSVSNIFVAWYFVRNALTVVAIISHLISPFRSSHVSHRTVSSSPTSRLATLIIYWPCFALFSSFFAWRILLIMPLCIVRLPPVAVLSWFF